MRDAPRVHCEEARLRQCGARGTLLGHLPLALAQRLTACDSTHHADLPAGIGLAALWVNPKRRLGCYKAEGEVGLRVRTLSPHGTQVEQVQP